MQHVMIDLERGEVLGVLAHGEREEEDVVLRADARVAPHRVELAHDRAAPHAHVAARGRDEPCDHADRRRLACTVPHVSIT